MIPRPPRSTRTDTLFPYTTLFRSYQLDRAAGALAIGGKPRLEPVRTEEAKQGWDWHNELSALQLELRRILDQAQNDKTRMALLKDMRRVLDRKSTRLNSSH